MRKSQRHSDVGQGYHTRPIETQTHKKTKDIQADLDTRLFL